MILYLDASALVKLCVAEAGSAEVAAVIEAARATATAVVSRAEVAAALARASRIGFFTPEEAAVALAGFDTDWQDLIRLEVNEPILARAATLAAAQALRGYDAVHLACALVWQESLGDPVTLATYDRELWRGARATGLLPWPGPMP